MQEVTYKRRVDEVLVDLEQLLSDERKYLLDLDATAIDALNQLKTQVERELLAFAPEELLSYRERLEVVRRRLQENLVLLVHAREQVQRKLGIEPQGAITCRPSNPVAAGTRLNLRG